MLDHSSVEVGNIAREVLKEKGVDETRYESSVGGVEWSV